MNTAEAYCREVADKHSTAFLRNFISDLFDHGPTLRESRRRGFESAKPMRDPFRCDLFVTLVRRSAAIMAHRALHVELAHHLTPRAVALMWHLLQKSYANCYPYPELSNTQHLATVQLVEIFLASTRNVVYVHERSFVKSLRTERQTKKFTSE